MEIFTTILTEICPNHSLVLKFLHKNHHINNIMVAALVFNDNIQLFFDRYCSQTWDQILFKVFKCKCKYSMVFQIQMQILLISIKCKCISFTKVFEIFFKYFQVHFRHYIIKNMELLRVLMFMCLFNF